VDEGAGFLVVASFVPEIEKLRNIMTKRNLCIGFELRAFWCTICRSQMRYYCATETLNGVVGHNLGHS